MTATTATTAGPAFTLTYTFAPIGGDAETRTHAYTDAKLAAAQLDRARELQARQGGRYTDAELVEDAPATAPAKPVHVSLFPEVFETRGSRFFASLAALPGAAASR